MWIFACIFGFGFFTMKGKGTMKKYLCFFLLVCLAACSTILVKKETMGLSDYEILLTFDDGPNPFPGTTDALLEVLKKYGIRAVFCLVGKEMEKYPHLVKRIREEGHVIVNHSYSHIPRLSARRTWQEIALWNRAFSMALGTNASSPWFRPPVGLVFWSTQKVLSSYEMKIFGVSVFEFDSECPPGEKEKLKKRIIRALEKQKGGVLVLHDGVQRLYSLREEDFTNNHIANRSFVPSLVEELVVYFQAKGYVFIDPQVVMGTP